MYEYIEETIDDLKSQTQRTFNNSRLRLLKNDELNVLSVKKESDNLFRKLKKQSESFFVGLIQVLAAEMGYKEEEYNLDELLAMYSPVLLYSFSTEIARKRARYFEAILSLNDMNSPEVMVQQKRNIRNWNMQVEEFAVDIEREITIKELKKAKIQKVQWVTYKDDRVCSDCADLNGRVFDIEYVPRRPHVGCRCWLKGV